MNQVDVVGMLSGGMFAWTRFFLEKAATALGDQNLYFESKRTKRTNLGELGGISSVIMLGMVSIKSHNSQCCQPHSLTQSMVGEGVESRRPRLGEFPLCRICG